MQASVFLKKSYEQLSEYNVDWLKWPSSHLCYRTANLDDYKMSKSIFATKGDLVHESEVRGRPISFFLLKKPIHYESWLIRLIEIPAPKVVNEFETGWDYLALVAQVPLLTVVKKLERMEGRDPAKAFLDPNIVESSLKLPNSQIRLRSLPISCQLECQRSESVYRLYQNLVHQTGMKVFGPHLVGTHPLGLSITGSPITIAIGSPDWMTISENFFKSFQTPFSPSLFMYQEQKIAMLRLNYYNSPVEIWISELPAFSQVLMKNLLLQSRLLQMFPLSRLAIKKRLKERELISKIFSETFKFTNYSDQEAIRLSKLSDLELYLQISQNFGKKTESKSDVFDEDFTI